MNNLNEGVDYFDPCVLLAFSRGDADATELADECEAQWRSSPTPPRNSERAWDTPAASASNPADVCADYLFSLYT